MKNDERNSEEKIQEILEMFKTIKIEEKNKKEDKEYIENTIPTTNPTEQSQWKPNISFPPTLITPRNMHITQQQTQRMHNIQQQNQHAQTSFHNKQPNPAFYTPPRYQSNASRPPIQDLQFSTPTLPTLESSDTTDLVPFEMSHKVTKLNKKL